MHLAATKVHGERFRESLEMHLQGKDFNAQAVVDELIDDLAGETGGDL